MPINKKSLANLRPAKKGEARNTKPAGQQADKRFVIKTTSEELGEWKQEASEFKSRRDWINNLRLNKKKKTSNKGCAFLDLGIVGTSKAIKLIDNQILIKKS